MTNGPAITGVICTHNRERFLERCIESLCKQTLDQNQYEILVVDNGSTDKTKEICEKYSSQKNFRYIFEPVLGLSNARNTGWNNACGDYVGYLDDDAVAADTWFEKALWCFQNIQPIPEWVGGPIDLEWEIPAPEWITEEYWTTLGWLDWGDKERFLTGADERLGGGNSFYLKSVLKKMKGFDTRLGRKKKLLLSGEETQFQHRLKSIGGNLFYHPGILIDHFVAKERIEPAFFYRRYYWGGITDYIMSKTLEKVAHETISQAEDTDEGSQFKRLLSKSVQALGFFVSANEKIQSRIYFSYVIGWLVAVIKYGWRKMDLDTV